MRLLPAQQFKVADDVFPRLKLVAAKLQTGGKLRMRVLPLNEVVAVEQVAFSSAADSSDLLLGQVHGHFHHRLHAAGVVPHQADAYARNGEWMGSQGQVHHGMVLWLQVASGYQ